MYVARALASVKLVGFAAVCGVVSKACIPVWCGGKRFRLHRAISQFLWSGACANLLCSPLRTMLVFHVRHGC